MKESPDGEKLESPNPFGILVIVRHGISQWNQQGLWMGLVDIDLSEQGMQDALKMAEELTDIDLDSAYSSPLIRARRTIDLILDTLHRTDIKVTHDPALNEKNYGVFTGHNKWEIKKSLGEEEFSRIRRGWDYQILGGESLKDVYCRASKYFRERIMPELRQGKNTLVVSHNNTIRALVKDIEGLTEQEVEYLEIGIGEVLIYFIDNTGEFMLKLLRGENPDKGNI